LYLADEVQAGYGRTGPQLWRFALAGVVPDMVSLGKPMGASYPLGALVTRREIADALARDYEYFSTFAATPVAAAARLAVLDVLQDRDIPSRAAAVGEHLRLGLRGLARRHATLGEVRGIGLVAGVDLHAPGGAPPRDWARDVLNDLVRAGVLAGLAGPSGTVLKVRPPLIWDDGHADLFVTALDRVLSESGRPPTRAAPHS
jgi:4-aminobutyrate aminotransferase-like enzyme